jgi:hypothetical protein
MLVTIELPAGPNVIFNQNAFDSVIGKRIPVHTMDNTRRGTLVAVMISPTGRSAFLTLDIEGLSFDGGQGQYST